MHRGRRAQGERAARASGSPWSARGRSGMLAVQLLQACSPGRAARGRHRGRTGRELSQAFGATRLPHAEDQELPGRLRRGHRDRRVRGRRARPPPRCCGAAAGWCSPGIPAPGADGLDPTDLVVRQLEVHTVFGAPPDAWAHTVRAFGAGLLDPLPLVTHELPLDRVRAGHRAGRGGDPEGRARCCCGPDRPPRPYAGTGDLTAPYRRTPDRPRPTSREPRPTYRTRRTAS